MMQGRGEERRMSQFFLTKLINSMLLTRFSTEVDKIILLHGTKQANTIKNIKLILMSRRRNLAYQVLRLTGK